MNKQLGFYIEQSRCSGCNACAMACKDKNNLDDERFYRTVTPYEGGAFAPAGPQSGGAYTQSAWAYWVSMACNHCDNPKCVTGCPTTAMHKREGDGIVEVDRDLCIGCRYCVWNCPYGAPKYDPAAGKMSKCDFCRDLVEAGGEPACVAACPLGLIHFGPVEELRATYGTLADISGLPDSGLTRPNLIINPHKHAEK